MAQLTVRPILRGARGVVACGHPLAAGCARDMFVRGGGAVDAAIAAAAALSVVLPDACGLGGDAMALVREADGELRAYNGSGGAPARLGGIIPPDGGGTVAVPGCVAAWQDLHRDHGRLDPAVLVPEGGYLLNNRLQGFSRADAGPNAPRPGARPVHTLSPMIIEHGDRVFALATPGGGS